MTGSIEPEIALAFSMHTNPGAHALLVGAGLSIAAQMPSAWQVQRSLILEIASAAGEREQAEGDGKDEEQPFVWFEQRYGKKATYDTLLDDLTSTQVQRQKLLATYFTATDDDRSQGRKQPTAAHHALAALVASGHVRIILTLNFDHLIEEALAAVNIDPVVLSTAAAIAGMEPLSSYQCLVIHLHGDYKHPEMRNTPGELAAYPEAINACLDRVLDEYGLIITGWSAQWDPALRDAFDRAKARRYPMYWVNPRPLRDEAAGLATRRGAYGVAESGETFFPRLRDKVLAIRDEAHQHPLTTSALVASAKRELTDINNRAVSTHDSWRRSVRAILQHPDHQRLTERSTPLGDREVHKDRVLAAGEALQALLATLAYWGTPDSDNWWRPDFRELGCLDSGQYSRPDVNRQFGSVLFWTAGVAATAAGRDATVARLLLETLSTGGLVTPAYEVLGPNAVANGGQGSRLLYEAVQPVLTEHLLLGADQFDDAWDAFEYLCWVYGVHRELREPESTSDRWTPHMRTSRPEQPPHIALAARTRYSAPASTILTLLFDGDKAKFTAAADRTDEILSSLEQRTYRPGSSILWKARYSD